MRAPRISFCGGLYHITTRCNNREFLFQEDADFQLFLDILKKSKERYGVKVYAYAVTNNHFHLVIYTPEENNVSRFMQYLNGCFAQAYNRKHGRSGRFWTDRFHSTIIESETQLMNTLAYLDLQMVRCGVVDDPKFWKWSSYHVYAYGEDDGITDLHEIYLEIAEDASSRQKFYREMVADYQKEKGLERNLSLSRGIVLGCLRFVRDILQKYACHPYYQNRKVYLFQQAYTLYRIGYSVESG